MDFKNMTCLLLLVLFSLSKMSDMRNMKTLIFIQFLLLCSILTCNVAVLSLKATISVISLF